MNKSYWNSQVKPKAHAKRDPHEHAPIPRYVIANFDRWCDAQRSGDTYTAKQLAAILHRAGFEVQIVNESRGKPSLKLRRSPTT